MSHDGQQRFIFANVDDAGDIDAILEALEEDETPAQSFGHGETHPTTTAMLDALVTLPWTPLDDELEDAGGYEIRVLDAEEVGPAKDAVGALVRRPETLAQEIGVVLESSAPGLKEIKEAVAAATDADAVSDAQRLARVTARLYRALSRAAASGQSLVMARWSSS